MERREPDGRKNGTRARVKSTEATALAERTKTLQFPALYDRRPHRTPQGVQNWRHNKKYKSWAKKKIALLVPNELRVVRNRGNLYTMYETGRAWNLREQRNTNEN